MSKRHCEGKGILCVGDLISFLSSFFVALSNDYAVAVERAVECG